MAARKGKGKGNGRAPKHGSEGRFVLGSGEVENPNWEPAKDGVAGVTRKVAVAINRRHDVIVWLHSRKQIDDAQALAGNRFLSLHERMQSGSRAIDYLKEPVDGGAAWPDLDVSAMEAALELDRLRAVVGHPDYTIMQHVICERGTISDVAMGLCGKAKEADRKYIGRRLRDALDVAAEHWGYAK